MVIQRRGDFGDGRENFFRGWADYKRGFGDKKKEFWLGNDQIHELTKSGDKKLRVELEGDDGTREWAEYDTFIVEDEAQEYRLRVSGFYGTAGDCLTGYNGAKFSTLDRENDRHPFHCAQYFKAGWWFNE